MYVCANGKYSLYSHGCVVRAQQADAGVSVRGIGCPDSMREGGRRLCSRRCGVEVETHAATRSQTLARCHHCFLHRARERQRHDGANNYLALHPSHIHFLLVELRRGCSFEDGVHFAENCLCYNKTHQLQ